MSPRHTVCITAHYVADRIPYLSAVLDAISGWGDCTTDVVLITNSAALREDEAIRAHEAAFREVGSALRHVVAEDLDHPFHLTWYHKRFVGPWRESAGADDLFVYLEDDIVLPATSLRYFQEHRPLLRPFGLIPSFVRFETRPDGIPVVVDLITPEFYGHRNSVEIGDLTAHVCRNPYWAGFILDRELADEYIGSRSFDIEASRFVGWDVRARAAMGACFENVPPGFTARNAIVVNEGRPLDGGLIRHCADTYTRAGHPHYGRLPVAEAFVTGSRLGYWIDRIRARRATAAIRRLEAPRSVDPEN